MILCPPRSCARRACLLCPLFPALIAALSFLFFVLQSSLCDCYPRSIHTLIALPAMRPSLLLALCCAVLALGCVAAGVQSQEISAPAARADIDQRAEEMGLVEMESLTAADAAEEAADAAEAAADERTAALDAAMIAEDEAAFSMEDDAANDHVLVEAGVSSPFTDKIKAKLAKLNAAAKDKLKKAGSKVKAGAASVKSKMQATMDKIKAALLGTPKPPVTAAVLPASQPKPAAAVAAAVKETKIPKFVPSRAATARDMRLKRQADLAKAKLAREAADAAEYAAAVKQSWQSKQFERPMYSEPIAPHPSSNLASRNGDRNFNTLFPANTPLSDGKASSQDADFQHAGHGDLYVDHTGMIQHTEAVSAASTARPRGAQHPEPCAEQCEGKGLWRTAPCQDCIVRGMTNGWIVKSIQEQQKGYAYVHYARNQCVKYANDQHLAGASVKGAPFAACFFQKMHETCNL